MIVLSNSVEQTIDPGQSATFDTIVMHTGCGERYERPMTGTVKLCFNGIYTCNFSCNSATGQLALGLNGSPLLETTMVNGGTTTANFSSTTAIKNNCGPSNITVINTGTAAVTIEANPCLFVKRVA